MTKYDQRNIADLYEEGLWDRTKASVSGAVSGVGGLLTGKGYAKTNQATQLKSLMTGKIDAIQKDILACSQDLSRYSNDPNTKTMQTKLTNLQNIINSYTSGSSTPPPIPQTPTPTAPTPKPQKITTSSPPRKGRPTSYNRPTKSSAP